MCVTWEDFDDVINGERDEMTLHKSHYTFSFLTLFKNKNKNLTSLCDYYKSEFYGFWF